MLRTEVHNLAGYTLYTENLGGPFKNNTTNKAYFAAHRDLARTRPTCLLDR